MWQRTLVVLNELFLPDFNVTEQFPSSLYHVTELCQQDARRRNGQPPGQVRTRPCSSPSPFPVHWMRLGYYLPGNVQRSYTYLGRNFFPILPHSLKLLPRYCVTKQTISIQFRRKGKGITETSRGYSFIKNHIEHFLCSEGWNKHKKFVSKYDI